MRREALAKALGIALLATVVSGPVAAAAPGDLDSSFGRGGEVETRWPGNARINALALQPDGKIVAFGNSLLGKPGNEEDTFFDVARYNRNGSLDTGFGSRHDGKSTIDFDGRAEFGNAVALQGDGKILIAGSSASAFEIVRLNPDGTIDSGFGNGGSVRTTFGPFQSVLGIAVQPDGKILAAGPATIIDGPQDLGVRGRNALVLARYNPDGSPDGGFGSGGSVILKSAEHTGAYALELLPDGTFVTAGNHDGQISVRRFLSNGAPDPSFASGGEFLGPAGNAIALGIARDGKIVAGGDDDDNMLVVRLNPDGTPDGSFGTGGLRTIPPLIAGHHSISALGIQADGKVMWSGFGCGRLNADGSDDKSWDDRGRCEGAALLIQPDGKVVTAGVIGDIPVSENAWILKRWLTSGGPRSTALQAAGAKRQKVLKQKGVKLKVQCPQRPCIVDTDAKVKLGSGKPKRVPRFYSSPRKKRATIRIIFPKKVLAAIRRALAHGKKVTITLRVFAEFPEDPPTAPQTVVIRAVR